MSWLQKCFRSLSCCMGRRSPTATATEPPPSQPDKAPTDKEKSNDQQQQQQPYKHEPLNALQQNY